MPESSLAVSRALISVSDKRGVVDFAHFLAGQGVEILSTGGTAKALEEAGIPVTQVSDHTGFPEIMDGRVKTLHPKIHGGLLARRDLDAHRDAMAEQDIAPIDLLVANLYPFEETVAAGADFETCVENIDIGGPAMIRAAAKNHAFVAVVTDPDDYAEVQSELAQQDGLSAGLRQRLAAAAFARTAVYDAAVSNWFAAQQRTPFPMRLAIAGELRETLRYGENPHQRAALYRSGSPRPGIVTGRQVQGKALSFNNINDADAAFELAAEFERPAVAIIKHANPCGAAVDESLAGAYGKALATDPVSAFGGIIAANRPLDAETAGAIAELFAEVVIAPGADSAALDILSTKKNLRIVLTDGMPDPATAGPTVRSVAGGLLVQDRDAGSVAADALQVVTERAPTEAELVDLLFAVRVVKHVKSNAIVYARDGATVGIGAGQMSRVDSARTAVAKAAEIAAMGGGDAGAPIAGSVVASDAFFPFADGLTIAIDAGATAVIQPGGSMRDQEVIDAADAAGIAMVFTGLRHFRH